jgi:hypothetical protein
MLACSSLVLASAALLVAPTAHPLAAAPFAARRGRPVVMDIPTNPKDVATQASIGVQAALADSKRRLEVSCPDGLCFFGSGKQEGLGDPDIPLPDGIRAKADRDLAYLVCEMFQGLGGEWPSPASSPPVPPVVRTNALSQQAFAAHRGAAAHAIADGALVCPAAAQMV